MPVILKAGMNLDELEDDIRRLSLLVSDLVRVRGCSGPTEEELARAPTLEDWRVASRTVPCLAGRPIGHPNLSAKRHAATSPIWVLDLVRGYARTESRFYLLGKPAKVEFDA